MYQKFTYEKKETVALIEFHTLVREAEGIGQLSRELSELRTEIGVSETIRVILLAGDRDDCFSLPHPCHTEEVKLFRSLAEPIAKFEQPVIAAIQGDAMGQGLELILACDFRLASDSSHFGLLQIRNGLIPGDGGTQRLSRWVGKAKALEMILTGKVVDAQEALRIGLVSKVVPKEEVMKEAMKIALEMGAKGPIALRYAKEAVHNGMDMSLEQGLRLEADLYLLLHTTGDRTEGIKAFREKRTPRFRGK